MESEEDREKEEKNKVKKKGRGRGGGEGVLYLVSPEGQQFIYHLKSLTRKNEKFLFQNAAHFQIKTTVSLVQ